MRTIVFIDGQNLYHSARQAWSSSGSASSVYTWPSYDVEKLADALVSRISGRALSETRFYTGVPDPAFGETQRFWHGFWANKLRHLRRRGVYVYRGRVSPEGQEKGVDVSLAIDLVKLTYEQAYDVAIIISQDWDFGPAVRLAKEIAQSQNRSLVFESAFPRRPGTTQRIRGVPGTTWVEIEKPLYDACLDSRDYRPAKA